MSGKSDSKRRKRKNSGEYEAKSPRKRSSSERRQHAVFIAICETCGSFVRSTMNEVSSYIFEHMCESPEFNIDSGKKAVQFLEQKIEAIESQATPSASSSIVPSNHPKTANKNAKVSSKAKQTPLPSPPPSPPLATSTAPASKNGPKTANASTKAKQTAMPPPPPPPPVQSLFNSNSKNNTK